MAKDPGRRPAFSVLPPVADGRVHCSGEGEDAVCRLREAGGQSSAASVAVRSASAGKKEAETPPLCEVEEPDID